MTDDVKFNSVADDRGRLLVWELPFLARRVFVIDNTMDHPVVRGGHAHRRAHQFYVALQDSDVSICLNRGQPERLTTLHVPELTWVDVHMQSAASILLVAGEYYDEKEYVRDYDKFVALRSAKALARSAAVFDMLLFGVPPENIVRWVNDPESQVPSLDVTIESLREARRLVELGA